MRKSELGKILLSLFVLLGCVLVGQEIKQETGVALYPLCQEASKMDYFLDFKHKKVRVVFDTGKTAIPDERIELECYVWGTKIRRTAKFYDGKAVCELPMPEPGKYNLGGILRLDGNFFFDLFRMLQIPEKAPEPVFDAGNMKLTYSVDPDDMTLDVKVDASLTGVDNGKLSGEVSFAGTKAKLQFANCVGKVIVPLPKPCVPGKQDIIADLTDGNGAKAQLKSVLTIPSTEWLGNKIGLDDVVLPPWTPLRRKGSSIFCLNREYVFGKDGLPSQIVSAGKQILSAPITLKISKGGKEVKWQPRKMRIESCTETKAKIVGVGAANGSEIEIVTELEYDGYMYIVARPLGAGELPFDELSLELPVKRENALYRHLFSVYKVVLPKSVPEGEGIVEESPWRPFAWLGDNYRGLFWCCESDEMWPNRDGNAVQFIRDAKSVTLRLNVIKAGQKIKKDWNLAFMLMATPVKNYDARKNRKTRLYGYGKNLEFNFGPGTTVGCGFVKSDPKVDLGERVKLLQERGVRVTPYTVPTFMTYAMPESVFFKKYWWFGFDDAAILNSGWPDAWYCASPAGKGFADFLVWHAKEYLEKNHLNGFYYDQFHPYAYAGKSAGTGYEENGVYRATYPIRAQRQLFKRLYSLVRSQPRDTWVWAHMSAKMNIAALSWNDGYFDGEHPFAALVRDKSYMEVMSLDTFRAEFIGRQWGLAPFFLPEMRGEMVKTPDATRELMAMGMVHDVPICRLWVDSHEMDRIRRELDLFDYGNSDFYAYYDDVPPASTDMKEVYVSAYKHDNGSVLFVAANLSAEKLDRTGTIRIDRKCLNVGPGKYISWPDRKPMEAEGDVIKLTVPRMGYRMFVLGNPPEIELPDMPIGNDWILVNFADRAPDGLKTKRLLPGGDGFELKALHKDRVFMHEVVRDAEPGQLVTIEFEADGTGKLGMGFFLNKNYSYAQVGQMWQSVDLTPERKKYCLQYQLKHKDIKSIRHVISVKKGNEARIYTCKVKLEKGNFPLTAEAPKPKPTPVPAKKQAVNTPLNNWAFASASLNAEKDALLKEEEGKISLYGKRYFIYFRPEAIKVNPGDEVVIKIAFQGKARVGLFTYTDYKYGGFKILAQDAVALDAPAQKEFRFKITAADVKQIRPMISIQQGSEFCVTDYNIEKVTP